MIFKHLRSGIEVSDSDFDAIYTERIRKAAEIHFTSVEVAKIAARFLAEKPGSRVLDIGSGAGKFCMIGAACTNGHFMGIEHRKRLYRLSERLSKRFDLGNVSFIYSNVTEIGFKDFDAIYYFNAFYENIAQSDPIDRSVKLARPLYDKYILHVKEQLEKMHAGTRLATYFSYLDEVPDSYEIRSTCFDRKLKLWEKTV